MTNTAATLAHIQANRMAGAKPDLVAELHLTAAKTGKPLSQVMRELGIQREELK